jgi:hypothetical protein
MVLFSGDACMFNADPIQHIAITHPDLGWEAIHDAERFGGPTEIKVDGLPVLRDNSFHVDDVDETYAVIKRQRLFHKGGAAVVQSEGYFPFGGEIRFFQTCRYAMNHLRVIFDLEWARGSVVKQSFGLGCLRLPGRFKRFFTLPPAAEQMAGQVGSWQEIPAADGRAQPVGSWSQPPPAWVFEREDGLFIEIGTGSDLWRWEECLGAGAGQAGYQIIRTDAGLEIVRNLLACPTEFLPTPRPFRFTWYAAWGRELPAAATLPAKIQAVEFDANREPKLPAKMGKLPKLLVDMSQIPWPASALRTLSPADQLNGIRQAACCWESDSGQKSLRRLIRKLRDQYPKGTLVVKGVSPACCWDPSHLEKPNRESLAHWDINGIIDLFVWLRHQLGPGWEIRLDQDGTLPLPSLAGLGGINGFAGGEE